MSLVSGVSNIRIPFVIPQTPGNVSGALDVTINGKTYSNTTVFTTINRGTYLVNWNPRVSPDGGIVISSFRFALTINAQLNGANSITIATSPLVGNIGQGINNPVTWGLSNIFTITNDNTPVYVYMNVATNTGGKWYMATSNDVSNLDDIDFTRLY